MHRVSKTQDCDLKLESKAQLCNNLGLRTYAAAGLAGTKREIRGLPSAICAHQPCSKCEIVKVQRIGL